MRLMPRADATPDLVRTLEQRVEIEDGYTITEYLEDDPYYAAHVTISKEECAVIVFCRLSEEKYIVLNKFQRSAALVNGYALMFHAGIV